MLGETDTDTSSLYSSSSSDLSVQESYVAEFRGFDRQELTSRYLRNPSYNYSIHTYLAEEPRGTVVDKIYPFSFTRAINPERFDTFFRFLHPQSISVYNPSRIAHGFRGANTKVGILRGTYKDQSGVIVKSYFRRLYHEVLVYDGTILVILQKDIKLLDPGHVLPVGYPIKRSEVTFNLT